MLVLWRATTDILIHVKHYTLLPNIFFIPAYETQFGVLLLYCHLRIDPGVVSICTLLTSCLLLSVLYFNSSYPPICLIDCCLTCSVLPLLVSTACMWTDLVNSQWVHRALVAHHPQTRTLFIFYQKLSFNKILNQSIFYNKQQHLQAWSSPAWTTERSCWPPAITSLQLFQNAAARLVFNNPNPNPFTDSPSLHASGSKHLLTVQYM